MKKLSHLFLPLMAVFLIYPHVVAQTIEVSADITENTKWSADTVKIKDDITVNPGITLTIQSGTVIQFQDYYMLNIKGSIRASGAPGDTILFTRKDTLGFHNVESDSGGWNGIKIDNSEWDISNSDTSVFKYCRFSYSKSIATGDVTGGGAILIRNFSNVLIQNCLFDNNISLNKGGAIYIEGNYVNPEINNCSFINNKAAKGGALYLDYNSMPLIRDCLFHGNQSSQEGGAIFTNFGKGWILNNTFSNNVADIYGGALCMASSQEILAGNLIVNNYAESSGGGIKMASSWPKFFNNHVCNNHSGWGGGLEFWGLCNADFYNNIIWGNTEFLGAKTDNQIRIDGVTSTPNFYHCIIQDGIAGIENFSGKSADIIEDDPQFINPSANTGIDANGLEADWTLSITSPAINQGSNTIRDIYEVETDLGGNQRIIHGIIDIGAYETRINSITTSDTITGNTLWIADTIRVTGDIIIRDSVTLDIAPGTCVEFQDTFKIQVFGTLTVKGSKNSPVVFTINDTTGFFNLESESGSWKGILFDNSEWGANGVMNDNDSSILRYCVIQYVKQIKSDWDLPRGGAISVRYFSNLEISNCTIQKNIAVSGGALGIDLLSNPLVSGNLIYKNIAIIEGGGIYIASDSKPRIINNFILNNSVDSTDTDGWSGGGGIQVYNADPFILDNVICNNFAYLGGAIFLNESKPAFSGNTVCNNLSSDMTCLMFWNSKPDIYNSIIWGNKTQNIDWDGVQLWSGNSINFYYNNIEGGQELMWFSHDGMYEGNIDSDPVFTNPTEGPGIEYDALQADWSITDYSPNINKGFPESGQLYLPGKDIAGKTRIRYEIIDIGAYENQGEPIHIISEPFNQIACTGDTIIYSVEVEGNAMFQWLKDGEEIAGADTNTLELDSVTINDVADYICVISNGYGRLLSNSVTLVVNSPPEILLQTESQWVKEDDNLKLEIHARGTEPVFYEWIKDDILIQEEKMPDFRINKMSLQDEGSYVCQVSNQCGEIQSVPITLFVAPQICMVTVDTETGDNLVIWEKKGSAPVSSYNIYRESIVAGEYDLIGHLTKDSLSIFLDTVADPSKQAYIYKITAIDTDGFESNIDLCKPHKTIHLITSLNMTTGDSQLEWDQYYGFTYGTYYIYRSLTESDFSIIHSMSSSTSAYTDPNPDNQLYYYRISVQRPEDCIATGAGKKTDAGPYSHSMSNIEDNRLQTGLNELNNIQDLTIFPNPFTERTTIRFPNPGGTPYALRIMDISGKVLRIHENVNQSEFILERQDLEKGYYLLELRGDRIFRGRIVVE